MTSAGGSAARPAPGAGGGRVLVCPTAFKGTFSPTQAADCLAHGARSFGFTDDDIVRLPLSDGGNGLLDALSAHDPGLARGSARVTGPLGTPVSAAYLWRPGAAVVESAEACGIHLVAGGRLEPLSATTFGVGELVRAALDAAGNRNGQPRLVLGLGGSATVDGGAGMARALGWRLLDDAGRAVPDGGAGLAALRTILPPARPDGVTPTGTRSGGAPDVVALADVRNPLLGADGAAAVFGPQKGADAGAVARLEDGLANLARRLQADLGVDVEALEGGGAAGGLGAGAVAFLGARLLPGARWVLRRLGFDARLARARAVITGEGAYDDQTDMGKVVGQVVERAVAAGLPVLVVAGRASPARPGVVIRSGEGGTLDARDLAALATDGLAELVGRPG